MFTDINITVAQLWNIILNKGISLSYASFIYILYINDKETWFKLKNNNIITQESLLWLLKHQYISTISSDNIPKITKKTIELFNKDLSLNSDINTKVELSIYDETLDVESWIQDFRNLFKGKKNGAMGQKILCVARMKEFISENPEYSKDDILRATEKYIQDKASSNYMYLRFAHYFIKKHEVIDGNKVVISDLLSYCEETSKPDIKTNQSNTSSWCNGLKIG